MTTTTMPRLTSVQRERAIGMLQARNRSDRVARHFGVHPSTISRLRTRLEATGSTADRPRPSQPRVTTPAADRHIRMLHLRDRFRTATRTAAEIPGRNNPRRRCNAVRDANGGHTRY